MYSTPALSAIPSASSAARKGQVGGGRARGERGGVRQHGAGFGQAAVGQQRQPPQPLRLGVSRLLPPPTPGGS